MILFKLGVLSCAFYAAAIALFEAVLWAVIYFRGFWIYLGEKSVSVTTGLTLWIIFGFLWAISFSVAWWIVYLEIKARLGGVATF